MKPNYILLFASILLGSGGQLLLKLAANSMSNEMYGRGDWVASAGRLLMNRNFLAGAVLFAGSMLLWLSVIAKMELSRAYPTVSLSYLLVFAASVIIFGETVTACKVAGLVAILLGVVLINI